MTGNIPEEIIRKIMYSYNSHPIVDLLKVDENLKNLEKGQIYLIIKHTV